MRNGHIVGTLILAGMLAGCASASPPTGKLEATAAAIRAAQEVGAGGLPQAALHLQLAKEQAEQANQLIADNQVSRASYVLLRAQSDAELAVVLARDNEMKQQAQQAVQRVRTLRQSNQLNQDGK